jgi:twitching motility protein PilU
MSDAANVHPSPAASPRMDANLDAFLKHMLKVDASDIYVTAGSPVVFRVSGAGHPAKVPLTAEHIDTMAASLMTAAQLAEFRAKHEMNLVVEVGEARFRVNVFQQRGATGMVIRMIKTKIRGLDELQVPKIIKEISLSRRGLILVVGATGSGKSTLLAAMINHRNESETGHIVTVEDPIEFVHEHKKCVITQREVGEDTHSFGAALKSALRQAPDVILIGEVRDEETMEAAVTFAETGHLCLATLHSNNANQAIERVLNFFPHERQHEILLQLSLNLRGIISQRLIPSVDGGRAACLEILLDTPRIRELIKRGEIDLVKESMEQAAFEGCRTFDASLFELVAAGRITETEALRAAESANNLRMRIDRWKQSGGMQADDNEAPLKMVPRQH